MNEEVLTSRLRISRRRAMVTGGAVSLGGLLAACADPQASSTNSTVATRTAGGGTEIADLLDTAKTCATTKANIEGPYWFNVDDVRQDTREDRPGTPLTVALRVLDTSKCASGGTAEPLSDCVVEVWHCDAGGIYSGFEEGSATAMVPPAGTQRPPVGSANPFYDALGDPSHGSYSVGDTQTPPTDDATYLRGAQVTDKAGIATFTTIFPGWYVGRTVHVHLKVHRDKATVLTTQMYFDEKVIAAAHSVAPYDEHVGRDTTNGTDDYFDEAATFTMGTSPNGQLAVLNIGIAPNTS